MPPGPWQLIKTHWKDKLEALKLLDSSGREVCSYIQTEHNTWLLWMNHFPLYEFSSRSGALRDAERNAGHTLEITEGTNGRNDSSNQNEN